MNRRRSSIAASPVLLGAAAVLIGVVAVVLSYNANKGLPFIKTYDLEMNVKNAKKLTTGVDVRIGGKRVGQVNGIEAVKARDGHTFARLALKLDSNIAELSADTTARIRPRSAIGAKFVELTPGRSARKLAAGGTIRESSTSASVDFDEVTALFDRGVRDSVRDATAELSNGFAGRGDDLNATLQALPGTLRGADSVFSNLADPRTDLGGFIRGLDSTLQAVRPVTPQVGTLVTNADRTLDALAAVRPQLAQSIAAAPGTLTEVRASSVALRPVLRDAAALARGLRPGARDIPRTARALNDAIDVGVPVLRRAPVLGTQLRTTFGALDRLVRNQSLPDTLNLLKPTAESLLPTLRTVVPAQTRCNYAGLFARNVSSVISEGDKFGNWFHVMLDVALPQFLRAGSPSPDSNFNVYNTAEQGHCEVGNEPFPPASRVGRPNVDAPTNPRTPRPANEPEGPR
ncbi:putativeMce family protein [Patulibacter medicamentivorans]|uniref:PutativeMce family protein n=1 Tax=Patulibacter medicamentivorans TaxID=1097667 RepID=H0EAY4_9ACTN|nr:MlaD family protein [Patulibacter medicamentivorans]EHN09152.1 putativeMce family protein [Patulibacter medicamentivorans]